MEKSQPYQKIFQEILDSQNFERLQEFENEKYWKTMSYDDRESLAILLILRGEFELKKGDNHAFDSFSLAETICPDSCKVLYREALACAGQHYNLRSLSHACSALEKAAKIYPDVFDIWYAWANVNSRLGMLQHDTGFFYEANKGFEKAFALFEDCLPSDRGNFYWQWGIAWFFIGKHSGEASDFYKVIEKYRSAEKLGAKGSVFWNDFGNALVEFSFLINRIELLLEAAEYYELAIEENAESYEAWLNLGCVAKRLFEISGREDHYFKAVGCLQKASTLNPDHFNIWLKWGQLLAFNAKLRRDIQLLEESSEKFSMADRCDPQHPIVISDWAEVLILMGGYYEKIELLKEAEKKIVKGIELYPTNPQLWYSYGSCLNELGRYFEDEEYFELAIEKFQYALSMNRELPYVWYGLGTSYFSLGDIRGDIQLFEKASRNYSKALDFGGVFSPQFWNDWGVVMMKIAEISQDQHHVELAVEKFEKAISIQESIEPKNIDPHWLYNYGCALDFLGDFGEDEIYYEKAVQILTQALNLDPNFSHAQYNLALSLSHLGEITMDVDCFHKANELFQEVIHHDSEDEMAWNEWGLSLLNLAQLTKDPSHPELANELYAQAESRFLTATALGCVHAYYNLACFYSLRGNYPCSMHFIEKAEQASALPSIEDMMNDEWLEGVRSTSEFRAFLIQLSAKYPQSEDEFNS